ncbi:hypothetical protein JOB18_047323 [Solea senegalensis]|uniref:Uncharacterized protein n=1 Tax=Solea senegalensis TaxID=28829 RepID=A0AAV6QJT1_SOLSE|nr:hypothetical protein JOB18_047323 [Solea senegalensis]
MRVYGGVACVRANTAAHQQAAVARSGFTRMEKDGLVFCNNTDGERERQRERERERSCRRISFQPKPELQPPPDRCVAQQLQPTECLLSNLLLICCGVLRLLQRHHHNNNIIIIIICHVKAD